MRRTVAAVAVLASVLVGCSAPSAKPSVRCEPYPVARATEILSHSDVVVERASAVKSLDHAKAWYVAIRFHGPGIEDGEVGVWATNDIESGSILAVDGFAKEFSNFPPNDAFATTDKGADEVRTCV